MGFAAADLALVDAGLSTGSVAPDRFGVVFGSDMIYADPHDLEGTYRRCAASGSFDFEQWGTAAMEEIYPLWLLKLLPNMTASHIAIAHDARGPNNSIVLGDVSSLLAIAEAASVIERGWADVMITGGTGCRLDPTAIVARCEHDLSHRNDDPQRASRPFDQDHDGLVNGEGSGAIVLESLDHALSRGARIHARLLSVTARHEPVRGNQPLTGSGLRAAIRGSLMRAGLEPKNVGHVNAHGLSTVAMDRVEAAAIAAELGNVPVTAPKASFGHLGGRWRHCGAGGQRARLGSRGRSRHAQLRKARPSLSSECRARQPADRSAADGNEGQPLLHRPGGGCRRCGPRIAAALPQPLSYQVPSKPKERP